LAFPFALAWSQWAGSHDEPPEQLPQQLLEQLPEHSFLPVLVTEVAAILPVQAIGVVAAAGVEVLAWSAAAVAVAPASGVLATEALAIPVQFFSIDAAAVLPAWPFAQQDCALTDWMPANSMANTIRIA
jgi:hypothetical protein